MAELYRILTLAKFHFKRNIFKYVILTIIGFLPVFAYLKSPYLRSFLLYFINMRNGSNLFYSNFETSTIIFSISFFLIAFASGISLLGKDFKRGYIYLYLSKVSRQGYVLSRFLSIAFYLFFLSLSLALYFYLSVKGFSTEIIFLYLSTTIFFFSFSFSFIATLSLFSIFFKGSGAALVINTLLPLILGIISFTNLKYLSPFSYLLLSHKSFDYLVNSLFLFSYAFIIIICILVYIEVIEL